MNNVRIGSKWCKLIYKQPLSTLKQGGDKLVMTEIDINHPVAMMTLNRPPVNSLSLEMCNAITSALSSIENEHPHIHSLVLNSSNSSIFSAGLDITELYRPDPNRLPEFWKSFQDLFIKLYGSRLATIAAIEGSAIAGGCMVAMSCDYRIISSNKITIGLNETKLGIAAPFWMSDMLIRTIGFRKAEIALSMGSLFLPEEALKVGFVDEIVSPNEVISRAHHQAEQWAKIPSQARVVSKKQLRQRYITELQKNQQQDIKQFCAFINDDDVQLSLAKYMAKLKNNS